MLVALFALLSPALAAPPPSGAAVGALPASAQVLVPARWSQPSAPVDDWWTPLGGDELAQLIELSSGTADAQSAVLRVERSRALTQQTTATLLPSLSVGGNGNLLPTAPLFANPSAALPEGVEFPDTYVNGGLSADLTVPLSVW